MGFEKKSYHEKAGEDEYSTDDKPSDKIDPDEHHSLFEYEEDA